ncbi:N-acetylmuramoyl-L-alanine amidase [Bifidobacterium crudilactis]|jgi:hypothetical protein|uniref:N-acetylmuramoyl-L-alanine amidase n=1 Tax=Bifidobacterium crudilactis TaxID=327277 RepID=UPI00235429EA|nr:peptidoglycan recognition family protein [Bifidobacterium crudilactis]MCI2158282.1 N-acetylmuramoyl-L-alanine amidase [Bifidobacterium crudilactis]
MGKRVTRITLHIMAGYLTGTDSIFQSPSRQASSNYGIGASGEIHQYVAETDGAWADGNRDSNLQTISIEHQGGLNFIPCTQDCLNASARLCADIARRYGWPKLVHGQNVFLHREIPGTDHTTCPDLAPNGLNYQYVINKANELLGGNTMTSAADIWNYGLGQDGTSNKNNQPAWVRLSWVHHDTARLYKMLTRTDDGGTKDGSSGDIYTRVCFIDRRVREMSTTMTAQAAAIESLCKAIGTNPADIGKIIQDAVKEKLDAIEINVTTTTENEG